MTIIGLKGLDDIQEVLCAPEGAYYLTCLKATDHVNKENGNKSVELLWHVDAEDGDYENVFDYMSIPGEGDDKESAEFKGLFIKRRLHYLNILGQVLDDGNLDTQDMVGQTTIVPINLTNEEYKGRISAKVAWPNLPTPE